MVDSNNLIVGTTENALVEGTPSGCLDGFYSTKSTFEAGVGDSRGVVFLVVPLF